MKREEGPGYAWKETGKGEEADIQQVDWIEHNSWLKLEGEGEGEFVITISQEKVRRLGE